MIASMTGFARREASGAWGTLICELRSVNHRFLEIGFRLPDALRALEPDFRRLAQAGLKRGKVDCSFSFRGAATAEGSLDIDEAGLGRLLTTLRGIAPQL